ncbi:MAG: protein kinase [Planctomycetes bacterium]|nr:protein kinase [Planctomycetota bacterium]
MSGAYKIGEFVLESKLGEGGMGVVFRARQVTLDRWVALKLLSRPASSGDRFVQRFHREARSAAQLVHPNIIQIYTIGEHKGAPYYTMEYIEGQDLHSLLQAGQTFNVGESVEIVRAVAKALAMANEHGIVHRDIKPHNIMISRTGLIKVMDFGLAKATSTEESLTQDGQIMGTPTYMSPEQGMSKEVDTRSDLYSLGCVLYECLAGRPPFQGENVASLIFKHQYEAPDSLREINPDIPEQLETICIKMLAKKPEERFQTANELLEALVQINVNTALAESTLAKHAAKAFEKPEREQMVSSEDLIPDATKVKMPEGAPAAQPPKEIAPQGVTVARAGPAPWPGAPAGNQPPRPPKKDDTVDIPAGFVAQLPASSRAQMNTILEPPPAYTPREAPDQPFRTASGRTIPKPGSSANAQSVKVPPAPPRDQVRLGNPDALPPDAPLSYFQRLNDRRWAYDPSRGHCKYAEGMAAEALPGADILVGTLGDCLVCTNWNRRHGCALAAAQHLLQTSRSKGANLLEEVAALWCASGSFERAIAMIELYISEHADEAGGYRALARIYERPDYPGKDRGRAIVLYNRFLELAGGQPDFSPLEIQRAQERIKALQTGLAGGGASLSSRTMVMMTRLDILHSFRCFYRQERIVYFAFGAMSRERIVIAKAGEVDPETGVTATDVGPTFASRATSIFRSLKSERSKSEERELVRKTLEKLANTPFNSLAAKESGSSLVIQMPDIASSSISTEPGTGNRTLTFKVKDAIHQLVFPGASWWEAERCAAIIKRLTGR